MAASISGTVVGIGRGANLDDDSDYGSDFSAGEEQLVDAILAGLAPNSKAVLNNVQTASALAPTATATTTTTTTTTAPKNPTIRRTNNNGQSQAHIPGLRQGSSPAVGRPAPSGLGQLPLASNGHASSLLYAGQDAVSRDALGYPDCKCTIGRHQPEPRLIRLTDSSFQ